MRFASLLLVAAFVAASGTAMADQMSGASPKPSASAMHSTKSSSMKNSSSMKSEHMKSNSSSMKSTHAMASPKPTMKP